MTLSMEEFLFEPKRDRDSRPKDFRETRSAENDGTMNVFSQSPEPKSSEPR